MLGRCFVEHLLTRTLYGVNAAYSETGQRPPAHLWEEPRCRVVRGDLGVPGVWEKLLENADCVVHLAQKVHPVAGQLATFADAVAGGAEPTSRLFELLARYKRPIHLIFPSSGGTVYSSIPGRRQPYSETEAPCPVSAYGIQKVAMENYIKLVSVMNHNVTANILRITNPYGVAVGHGRGQGFIGVALENIRLGLPIKVWGSPDVMRDFIHLHDVSRAILNAIEYRAGVEIVNIGSGVATKVCDVVALISSLLGYEVACENLLSDNPFIPDWNAVDIRKAAAVLGWAPEIGLTQGLQCAIEYMNGDEESGF
jgi:UDP-glucose 4-epimerase